jgi:hypothetical protein
MPPQQPPFKSDYSDGSQTVSGQRDENDGSTRNIGNTASQTPSVETDFLAPVDALIKPELYGTSKPRRIVIRGRIARE